MPKKKQKLLSVIGEISSELLFDFVEEFHEAEATKGPLTVYIHSQGGGVEAGTAMYELLRTSQNPVTTIGFGDVSSMAVLLLAAGDRRILTEGTRLLLHDGGISVNWSLMKAKKHMDEMLFCHDWYAQQLADRAGGSLKTWLSRLDDELFIDAETACKWGLAEEIRRYKQKKVNVGRSKS